jgi:putative restriction endonuclease
LPETKLIEAAHIIPDSHSEGYAQVTNGIALSCLHHRAYDRNLIGIDPDYIVHVSDSLLSASDGPILENGLKGFHGVRLHLPKHYDYRPNRDYLARRFEQFSEDQ